MQEVHQKGLEASAAPSWIFQRCLFSANAHTLQTQVDALVQDHVRFPAPQPQSNHQQGGCQTTERDLSHISP